MLKASAETRMAIQGFAPRRSISPAIASRKSSSSVRGPMRTKATTPQKSCDIASEICNIDWGSSTLSVSMEMLWAPSMQAMTAKKAGRHLMDETLKVVFSWMLCRKKWQPRTARMFTAIRVSEKSDTGSIPMNKNRAAPIPCASRKTSRVRRAGESLYIFKNKPP